MKKISLINQNVYTCWTNIKPKDEKKFKKVLNELSSRIFDEYGNFKSNLALLIPIAMFILCALIGEI